VKKKKQAVPELSEGQPN